MCFTLCGWVISTKLVYEIPTVTWILIAVRSFLLQLLVSFYSYIFQSKVERFLFPVAKNFCKLVSLKSSWVYPKCKKFLQSKVGKTFWKLPVSCLLWLNSSKFQSAYLFKLWTCCSIYTFYIFLTSPAMSTNPVPVA